MKVELVGGPLDGRRVDVTSDKILIPELVSDQAAVWIGDDEPVPAYVDAGGQVHFGKPPAFTNHAYERGEDGKYHYQERRQ